MKKTSSSTGRSRTPVKAAKTKTITRGKSLSEFPVKLDKNDNVSIRQIENGFIVSESGYKGTGKNQQWFNKEYFSTSNPIKFGKK